MPTKRITIISAFILLFVHSYSQSSSQLKKATRLIDKRLFEQAKAEWETIVKQSPKNANYNFKLGLCNLKTKGFEINSISNFEIASKRMVKHYDFHNTREYGAPYEVLYFLGEAYQYADQPDSAINCFVRYIIVNNGNPPMSVEARLKECMKAKSFKDNQNRKQILRNAGKKINTKDNEICPVVSWDENTMYFASDRPETSSGNKIIFNVYYSEFKNNAWDSPKLLIALNKNARPLFVSKEGNELYLCVDDENNKNIYKAVLRDNRLDSIVPMSFNTEANEEGFSMSLDEKTLYFTSDRKGGRGGYDIYSVSKNPDGSLSKPVNMGSCNTSKDELSPFILPDLQTLFFSSNGFEKDKIGGFDLYFINKKDPVTWAPAMNIGLPINSGIDDLYLTKSASETIVYTAKKDPTNGFDIFTVDGFNLNDYIKKDETQTEETTTEADAPINDPEIEKVVDEIEKEADPIKALDLIKELSVEKAAEVLNHIDPKMSQSVMSAIDPQKAVEIMNNVDNTKAVDIINEMPVEKAAPLLESMEIEKAVDIVDGIETQKAIDISQNMEIEKAVDILEQTEIEKSVDILEGMPVEKAIDVIENLEVEKAVDIVSAVEPVKASGMIENMDIEKSVGIVEAMEPNAAAGFLSGMSLEKATGVLEAIPSEKAATVVQNFDLAKSVEVVGAMGDVKAAQVIQNMDIEKAVDVMDGVSPEKAAAYIQNMEVEKAVDILGDMSEEANGEVIGVLNQRVNSGDNTVVSLLKQYFAEQIKNKESIIFKTIYFDFNSSQLLLLSQQELVMLVNFLSENKNVKVEVIGHTDNVGNWDANLKVSGDRAKVVYDFLRENKIAHDRIIFYGKGPAAPISTNDTDEGRKLNRRVEVVLLQ